MKISDLVEAMDPSPGPGGLVSLGSDGGVDLSSVDSDPNNGLAVDCAIVEKFDQGVGPWLFEVLTCALRHDEEEVASVHAYFIKKEEIQVFENKKKSLRQAMKDEARMLNVMFELPKIFHPHGHVRPNFLLPLSQCFTDDDMRAFNDGGSAAEHPSNRAWILLLRDLVVDEKYRRLGIAGNMIRKTLRTVLDQCVRAARPLLVAVQPKRIDEFKDKEWSHFSEFVYQCRVNEVFWENIGFKRYKHSFGGFTAPWHFWVTALRLPPKKRILIPDDLENRNTRTATPPLRPRTPRTSTRATATPRGCFPVIDETEPGPAMRSSDSALPTLPPAPPTNDSAPGNATAANTGRRFDNHDDPLMAPENAQHIRDLMRTMDAVGKKYRVRPLKDPVQTPVAECMSRQPNCPFKAPSAAIAPQPTWLART